MGEVMSVLWQGKDPVLPQELQCLNDWPRERLMAAMNRFRSQSAIAVRQAGLVSLLALNGVDECERIWQKLGIPHEGSVDFLSIIMPMVVISEMHYISKVTFLFSICDFNAAGTIKRSEFFIGLRAIVKGLQRFFDSCGKISAEMMEAATSEIFKKIDVDHSGVLELEEIVTFGYRSRGLRTMLCPFPSGDVRQYEELTYFGGTNRKRELERASQLERAERHLQNKLKITPDPGGCGRRPKGISATRKDKPWREPTIITKPRSYIAFSVYMQVAENGSVSAGNLRKHIGNRKNLLAALEQAYDHLQEQPWAGKTDGELRTRTCSNMSTYLETAVAELQPLSEDEQVSMHRFLCLMWPRVSDKEVYTGFTFCRQFQAMATLEELLRASESALTNSEYEPGKHGPDLDVDQDDIQALFEALDVNKDGKLSVEELTAEGAISAEEAEKLLRLWDRDFTGQLNKGEILNIVYGINQVVQRQLKNAFAMSIHGTHNPQVPQISMGATNTVVT
mmetsp:Transcript_3014/g.7312  ORF Transcript_3014/g.7312 Transcript_3014/m.7312 type:complete len:507 (+) Transcript_3014:214-1734(+)|eukprot:CAMPEP_0206452964 /NCGR_PEP_ID=MMETSP0324_2-20121206/20254_1 /ASSEMBLY_ACC=CAM_ASM_000836 /TAXON_ID=2866 /ORGANISM="Crypthecodinium cohnii, Strain Seligo" /LENGTH=506 /DNA_ID=CAMNT_0053923145 /DNA_START=134 /DNA_END=1654 /DNA_ORIENTATION=-